MTGHIELPVPRRRPLTGLWNKMRVQSLEHFQTIHEFYIIYGGNKVDS